MPISSGAAPARASVRHSLPSGCCTVAFAPDMLRRDREERRCTDHAGRGIENGRGGARNCSKATFCCTWSRTGRGARSWSCPRRSTALPDTPSACSKTCSDSSAPAGSSAEAKGAPPTRTYTIRSGHAGPCSVAGNRYGGRSRRRDRHPCSAPDGPLQISGLRLTRRIAPRAIVGNEVVGLAIQCELRTADAGMAASRHLLDGPPVAVFAVQWLGYRVPRPTRSV
jgi:hypothetical protein